MTVSILMSVYNPNWEYLKIALESIESQTYRDFELVVVNDGCDNERLKEMLQVLTCETRIVVNSTNLGLPKSLNRGIRECRGEYIARMDDDDIMDPHRLEKQIAQFNKDDGSLVAVFTNCRYIDKNGKTLREDKTDINSKLEKVLTNKGNCLVHSSLFIKKQTLIEVDGYDEKMTYAQDYDLYLRLMKKGKLYAIPETLICFRTDPDRIPVSKHLLSALFAYYATLKYLQENFHFRIFWVRTFIFVRQIRSILKEKANT